jgi:hypothetical protein
MDRLAPWFAISGIVLLLVAAVRYSCGRVSPSTLSLESDALVFLSPGRRNALEASLEARRHRGEGAEELILWEADCKAMRKRRRETLGRGAVTQVEDLGAWRGIAVGAATNTLRLGQDLAAADREWLVEVLKRWKESPA